MRYSREEKAADLRQRLRDMDIKIVSGMDGLIEVATMAAGRDLSDCSGWNDQDFVQPWKPSRQEEDDRTCK